MKKKIEKIKVFETSVEAAVMYREFITFGFFFIAKIKQLSKVVEYQWVKENYIKFSLIYIYIYRFFEFHNYLSKYILNNQHGLWCSRLFPFIIGVCGLKALEMERKSC